MPTVQPVDKVDSVCKVQYCSTSHKKILTFMTIRVELESIALNEVKVKYLKISFMSRI